MTFKPINFKLHDTSINSALTYSDIYTVPVGKIAKITIDFLNFHYRFGTTGTGGQFGIHQAIKIGDVDFTSTWLTQVLAETLSGELHDDSNLADAANFFPVSGEFILPRTETGYLRSTSGQTIDRWAQGQGGGATRMIVPDQIPRTWYLSAGQKVQMGTYKQDVIAPTFTAETATLLFAGSAIEENA